MSNLSTVAQLLSAGTNVLFVIVIAVGYYMMIRLYRKMIEVYDRMLHLQEEQYTSMGRPLVVVDNDYGRLPQVDIVVRNLSTGAAKDITFEFSAPVESSDGTVISDLSYFRDGLDFLSPSGEISCYWEHLDNLLPMLREKGLEEGILVTTRYKDLAGEPYETAWNLKPTIYQDGRYVQSKDLGTVARGVEDLVGTVKELLHELKPLLHDRERGRSAVGDGRHEDP